MALDEQRADECPGCHNPLDESTNVANQWSYKAEPIRCHACTARDASIEARDKVAQPGAVLWYTSLKRPTGPR